MLDSVTVVLPTVGRASLQRALAPLVGRIAVVVVDDRAVGAPLSLPPGVAVVRSGGRGPAAARNAGWRGANTTWVAFLDDDVEPPPSWVDDLARDLAALGPADGGSQGRIIVPTPARPTDWARSTKGLEGAVWATADLAYRREVLEQTGGFDERFPRAYREDADLGLRVTTASWRIVPGDRTIVHPVRPARWSQSIRSQRGNADDVLMRALHGPHWRRRAQVPPGRRRWHLVTSACLLASLPPSRLRPFAALAWAGLTVDFARRRIAPGPGTPAEVATMVVTSAVVPVAATWHWLAGWGRLRSLLAAGPATRSPTAAEPRRAATPADHAAAADHAGTVGVARSADQQRLHDQRLAEAGRPKQPGKRG